MLQVVTATLNATAYTAITLPNFAYGSTIKVQLRTAADCYLASSDNPTHFYTLKSGAVLELPAKPEGEVLYAKAAGATPVLEIVGVA